MIENKFISLIVGSRRAFEYAESKSKGTIESLLSPQPARVYNLCKRYYITDESVNEVPREFLKEEIASLNSEAPKIKDLMDLYIDKLPTDEEASPENVARLFLETKKQSVRVALAEALLSNEEETSRKYLDQFTALDSGNDEESEEFEQFFQNVLPSQLLEEQEKINHYKIKLSPSSLNERIGGGAVRGHHIIVFSRPEGGKTLFCVDNIAGFLEQDLKVLYLGNEEPVSVTIGRLHTRITGLDQHQIRKSPSVADKALQLSNFHNLVAVGIPGAGLNTIESLMQKVKPDVTIVDQLRNVKCTSESKTLQLEMIANGIRQLGLKYEALMISVTQAGDSASNKLVLEMGDVDYSNTGIPGAADLMIGLGSNYDYIQNNMRMISLPKNKLSSRHEHFAIGIDTRFHKMESVE